MAAAKEEEEFTAEEVEVAAILCNLNKNLRARERRWRRRMQQLLPAAAPEIPSWGRRRPRSMPEEKPVAPPAAVFGVVAERDGAASPDTPLAYPESGGDDAPAEEDAKKPTSHEQWVHEQQGVVASLSQEKARLLKVKREQQQEEQEQARKRPRLEKPAPAPAAADPRAAAAMGLVLDLNEPARTPEEDAQARVRQAQAAAAAEWYRRAQLQAAMRKAAVSAGARRRRLEILRAKVACPLVSSRPRR